jgi:DNA-binding GntR family transcriptional regulator
MLDALERGDAASAREALRQDIESAYAHILAKQYTEQQAS